MQRHHLLPRQLLSQRCFGSMFDAIGCHRIGFDDFRRNGMLLPASDAAAVRFGLPLHRGPHRAYNGMVIARMGRIEAGWSVLRVRAPDTALARRPCCGSSCCSARCGEGCSIRWAGASRSTAATRCARRPTSPSWTRWPMRYGAIARRFRQRRSPR